MKRTLHLVLTAVWYDQMKAGKKDVEYRQANAYWRERLEGAKAPGKITFSRGYTSRHRITRPVLGITKGPCPYPGWTGEFYVIQLGPIEDSNQPKLKPEPQPVPHWTDRY